MVKDKKTSGFGAAIAGLGDVGWDNTPATAPAVTGTDAKIRMDLIDADPDQPRKQFDPQALAELADSLREHGLQQPIGLRPHPEVIGRFMIRFGERRWRAAQILGWAEIPAIVSEGSSLALVQLIENIQRADLSPLETARAMVATGLTPTQLSKGMGKSKQWVTYHLSLVSMPEEFQAAMRDGAVQGVGTLYEAHLLAKDHPAPVAALLEGVSADQPLTRGQVRELSDRLRGQDGKAKDKTKPADHAPAPKSRPEGGMRVFVADDSGDEIGYLDLGKPTKNGHAVVVRGEDGLVSREEISRLRIVRIAAP